LKELKGVDLQSEMGEGMRGGRDEEVKGYAFRPELMLTPDA
jgi:hypothetical protein